MKWGEDRQILQQHYDGAQITQFVFYPTHCGHNRANINDLIVLLWHIFQSVGYTYEILHLLCWQMAS